MDEGPLREGVLDELECSHLGALVGVSDGGGLFFGGEVGCGCSAEIVCCEVDGDAVPLSHFMDDLNVSSDTPPRE